MKKETMKFKKGEFVLKGDTIYNRDDIVTKGYWLEGLIVSKQYKFWSIRHENTGLLLINKFKSLKAAKEVALTMVKMVNFNTIVDKEGFRDKQDLIRFLKDVKRTMR